MPSLACSCQVTAHVKTGGCRETGCMLPVVAGDAASLDCAEDEPLQYRLNPRKAQPTNCTLATDFVLCFLFTLTVLLGIFYVEAQLERAFEVGYAAGFELGARAAP